MAMTTLERCLEFLDRSRINYAHTKHPRVFTAAETAFAEHVSPHKLAKTVVYATTQGYGLAVVPADHLINLETLGAFLNDPEIRLASEAEVAQLFPESEVGAMPPIGNLFHLPVIVDTSIAEQEFIVFNAGTHEDVIHMSYGDFRRLVNPAAGKFTMAGVAHLV